MTTPPLHVILSTLNAGRPLDVDEAADAWGVNCGPAAVAALLGKSLADVRHAFPWFPARPWCSPTQLGQALSTLGIGHRWTTLGMNRGPTDEQKARFSAQGLVVVQIDGPWCDLANKAAAYRYTHTVSCQRVGAMLMVYDINAGPDDSPGGWLPFPVWDELVMRDLVAHQKRATGWFVRSVFELPQPLLVVPTVSASAPLA